MSSEIIVKSAYPDIKPVVGVTVPQFLWGNLHKWPKAICLECGVTGRKYTYEEAFTLSRRFAAGLIKIGLKAGDIIALVLPNSPEFAIALLGAWEVGCVVSPVNPAYAPPEIIHQLSECEAVCAITIDPFIPVMKAAKQSLQGLQSIIIVSAEPQEEFLNYSEMFAQDTSGITFSDGKNFDTQTTTALLPYSSGTAGKPKGVMLTHANLCTNILQFAEDDIGVLRSFDDGREQGVLIGLLPFFHIFGLTVSLLTGMYQGAKIVTLPKFLPDLYVKTIKQHKPTVLHVVTPLVTFLINSPDLGAEDFQNCHSFVAGATPFGSALINRLLEKAGKYINFQEGYGMTEMSPISHGVNPSFKNTKIGSMGRLMPSTEAKVICIESGKTLGANQTGELCIRGPQVMKGYYKNEEATKDMIDNDGFMRTGDVVYYDDDGFFFITDRLKELIKVKGFQVSPSELEDVIRQMPEVGDVAVLGVPYKDGEAPRAYIVRKSETLTEDLIHNYLNGKIADFKQLAGGIEFISTIPRAMSGKLLRRELRKSYDEKNKQQA